MLVEQYQCKGVLATQHLTKWLKVSPVQNLAIFKAQMRPHSGSTVGSHI